MPMARIAQSSRPLVRYGLLAMDKASEPYNPCHDGPASGSLPLNVLNRLAFGSVRWEETLARRTFTFAEFTPTVWRTGPEGSTDTTVVAEPAPDGVERAELQTAFNALPITVHDGFHAFNVKHDEVRAVTAYTSGTDEDPSPDEVREYRVVQPRYAFLYEFVAAPGQIYVTTTDAVIRRILRRARATNTGQGVALRVRNTDLSAIESALGSATSVTLTDVIGYKLLNVSSDTHIATLDVLGENISNNDEIQNAKSRAGKVRALAVRIQFRQGIIELWITEKGGVSYLHYPGDEPALELLMILNSIIEQCSDLESVTIR